MLLCFARAVSAQIVNIEERRITGTSDTVNWYGHVRLGANVSKVKDQVLQFNATGQVQYKEGKNLALLLFNGRFLRAGNKDFNQSWFAHQRYNYKLSDKLVAEAFLQAQYNKILLIKLRALAGAGLRYRFLKSRDGRQRLYAGLAYLYEHDEFLQGAGSADRGRLSSYVSFTFRTPQGVKLVGTTYFQPALADFGNYRLSSEWRLDAPLAKKLSFFMDFTYTTDQSLPLDAPTSTYAWLNGLGYKF